VHDGQQLLDRLSAHPLVQQMQRDDAEQQHQQRLRAGQEMQRLRNDRDQIVTQRRSTADEAARRLAEAAKLYQAALRQVSEANLGVDAALAEFDRLIAAQESILMRTSSAIIDETLRTLRRLFDETRSQTPVVKQIGRRRLFSGKRKPAYVSNQTAIERRLQSILAACAAAEAMRLDPDQRDLAARLETLINNLPDVEPFE
jgi:uncharacterized protein YdiU (UPF0061 family)